jgi:hypothetical protein
MKILFRACFHQKNFLEKRWPKIYQGQDPDPDPVENRPDPQHWCYITAKEKFKSWRARKA